jgi:hypothetical protein
MRETVVCSRAVRKDEGLGKDTEERERIISVLGLLR